MYYLLIIVSVLLFGGNFWCSDAYRKAQNDSSLRANMRFSLISGACGLTIMLIINGFRFNITPFSLIMALISIINGYTLTFCLFKALKTINLSLYSLFSQIGGMVLPFLQGIIFYGESLTTAKILCFTFITISLLLTIQKGAKKSDIIYYAGIFVLNGMSGVLSKIFVSAPFEKVTSAEYSILSALLSVIVSSLFLIFTRKKKISKLNSKSILMSSLSGSLNRLGNFILLIALSHVDSSVQYPMVTGGIIIVSTIISYFGDKKPNKKELLSVTAAFLGLLFLFILP